jgi:carbonic anhydrase
LHGLRPLPSNKHVAVVACMDAQPYEGPDEGEAHVIRNAGGVITEDVIGSLAINQRLPGTKEIILSYHTDCGMTTFTDDEFTQAVESDTGIKPNWLPESFVDADDGLRPSVRRIQASPFVTKHVWTRGFIFDVKTGKLTEFVLSREVMNG